MGYGIVNQSTNHETGLNGRKHSMRRQSVSLFLASAFLALSLMESGCSVKATFKETTDTTSNMTGTTSSARSWVSEDGHFKPEYQAIAFVTVNQTNLQHDMAQGEGEYLTSLGTLIGVPAHERLA
jgi:hypothetical protein